MCLTPPDSFLPPPEPLLLVPPFPPAASPSGAPTKLLLIPSLDTTPEATPKNRAELAF